MNRISKKAWNGLRQSVVVVSEASSSQASNTTVRARYGFTADDLGRQDHAF